MWDFFIFSCMRKNFIKLGLIAGFVCLSFSMSCQTTHTEQEINYPAKEGVVEVSEAAVSSDLHFLASDKLNGREAGSDGIEKAAVYIEDVFKKNGLRPYFETYRDSFMISGKPAYNLVGMLEGTDPDLKDQFIIIGAHYDHIGIQEPVEGDSIANGANDNAAGSVAVLELARRFAKAKNNKRSILFILFSGEEKGLLGSKHIAPLLEEKELDLYAMVNLEMIGVPMTDKDYEAYITGYELSNLASKFNEYTGKKVLGFLPQAKDYKLFYRSDNLPFYQAFKVPAQTISTFDFTNYAYYHQVQDEADELDISHMVKLIEDLYPGILGMANTPEKEIKLTEE